MSCKKYLTVLAMACAVSMPAMAQTLTPSQTNLDQAAAAKERRAASVRSQLAPVTADQAQANALMRCANLPAFYKVDCEARVNGQGQTSGSVIGGGVIKESTTQVTPAELANAPRIELKPQPEPAAPKRSR
ncbi:hypothetical protein [Ottowia caeni]|uniref:hypothetical protein n=1 Tax=Ottowia caeni TaxID=2870339 RepID=UPI001E54BDC6|nr:hypothetical protein [Ottowia caeni]